MSRRVKTCLQLGCWVVGAAVASMQGSSDEIRLDGSDALPSTPSITCNTTLTLKRQRNHSRHVVFITTPFTEFLPVRRLNATAASTQTRTFKRDCNTITRPSTASTPARASVFWKPAAYVTSATPATCTSRCRTVCDSTSREWLAARCPQGQVVRQVWNINKEHY